MTDCFVQGNKTLHYMRAS